MSKIRVHRKAHSRQGYRRSDGTYVKPAKVDESTFLTRDKGKRGRTDIPKRWFKSGEMKFTGYAVKEPERKRHSALRKADKKYGTIKVHHRLQGLANVTTDKKAEKVFRKDLDWVDVNLLSKKEGRRMTAKAKKARLLMGDNKGPG